MSIWYIDSAFLIPQAKLRICHVCGNFFNYEYIKYFFFMLSFINQIGTLWMEVSTRW